MLLLTTLLQTCLCLNLFFRKELQELDGKWSIRMARLEVLLTLGQRPTPQLVEASVEHKPPAGALSQPPF